MKESELMENQANEVIDGYTLFFKEFVNEYDEEKFIERIWKFAEQSMKYVEPKSDNSKKQPKPYVRTYGNKGAKDREKLLREFYRYILGEEFEILVDKTGNSYPKKMLAEKTDFTVGNKVGKQKLQNYQVSHIFGRTRNCFAYTAPWNVVYLPKILDPLTGHESKGKLKGSFTKILQKFFYDLYKSDIDKFNKKMEELSPKIEQFENEKKKDLLDFVKGNVNPEAIVNRFFTRIKEDFSPIEIERIEE